MCALVGCGGCGPCLLLASLHLVSGLAYASAVSLITGPKLDTLDCLGCVLEVFGDLGVLGDLLGDAVGNTGGVALYQCWSWCLYWHCWWDNLCRWWS